MEWRNDLTTPVGETSYRRPRDENTRAVCGACRDGPFPREHVANRPATAPNPQCRVAHSDDGAVAG